MARAHARLVVSTVHQLLFMRLTLASLATCSFLIACASAGCSAPAGEAEGSSADDLKTCAMGATVKGIDVSYYQSSVDWSAVKASGRVFAFARVSDGTKHVDPQFDTNWSGMQAAGVIRGAYQYFRPSQSASAQAQLFLSKIGTLADTDIAPALDVETADGVSSATVRSQIQAWLGIVEAATGRHALIYTANFMTAIIGNGFVSQPLWVANFGATCPTMPATWTNWNFFQSSDSGSASGVSGKVDLDVFNGTVGDLQAFISASRTGSAPAAPAAPTSPTDPTTPTDPTSPTDPSDPGTSAGEGTPPQGDPTPAAGGGACYSATLGVTVPELGCVDSLYDGGGWFQCEGGLWYRGATSSSGPYGPCSSSHPL